MQGYSSLFANSTEANYLRAQIARISAATQISPDGFYQRTLEDDNDDNESEIPVECIENDEYEEKPVNELTLENWVHHKPYILPQGRATW